MVKLRTNRHVALIEGRLSAFDDMHMRPNQLHVEECSPLEQVTIERFNNAEREGEADREAAEEAVKALHMQPKLVISSSPCPTCAKRRLARLRVGG